MSAETDKEVLSFLLEALDDVEMSWLVDEVRGFRGQPVEPSISDDLVAQSRRSYNASGRESPFEAVAPIPPEGSVTPSARDCIEYIAARIHSIQAQLQEIPKVAAALGIERVQLGEDRQPLQKADYANQLLGQVAASIREDLLQ